MAVIGWGKPRLFVKDLDEADAKWLELPTPVEDSTELTTEKGEKKEAKIEGGENEDVYYNKNTYALACRIRMAKNRKQPIASADGVVAHNYAVMLQPEDASVPSGISIEKSTVSCEETYTADEGGAWTYTFDALKPTAGNQVKWGIVTVTGEGDALNVSFKENTEE